MKILELTHFSSGVCGVWQRVKQESQLLSQHGYEVTIFSSNATKGSNELAKQEDFLKNNIKIKRFPFIKLGGESFMSWRFEKEALAFEPDIIIAHVYRHLHTTRALKVSEKLRKKGKNCKVFLVTHAPFIEDNFTRSIISKIFVNVYDKIITPYLINKFDKIISITKWELPYLLNLGIKKEKIVYIPNGIPQEFFKLKKISKTKKNNILFLGRISPIKNLELIINSLKNIKTLNLDIVGPYEKNYKRILDTLIKKSKLKGHINFLLPIYDLSKKINLIDNYNIFILPSKREAMPQSLIEAMARGKIVISSNTQGGKEIIENNKNGFLFDLEVEDSLIKSLEKTINLTSIQKSKIQKNAIKTAEKFKWNLLIKNLEKLF